MFADRTLDVDQVIQDDLNNNQEPIKKGEGDADEIVIMKDFADAGDI